MIYIDFETRSECDLKTAGAWKYSKHPSTEVLCMALNYETPPYRGDRTTALIIEQLFKGYVDKINGTIEAHNAFFEYAIWHNIMVPRYGWPMVPADQWYCSAAKAAYHGLPRKLEDAALALDLPVKKDAEGSRLMLQMSKPRPNWKKTGNGPKWFDDEKRLERLYEYCKQDVATLYALSQALDDLPPMERKLWLLDQTINRRGVYCDVELAQSALEIVGALETEAKAELKEITGGAVSTPGQRDKILDWLADEDLDLPNMQAETVEATLKRKDLAEDSPARRILEIRQLHSKASTKKYKAMLDAAGDDQRMQGLLLYHGAHTGRWTGRRVQPTNFFVPKFPRDEIELLAIPEIKVQNTDMLSFLFGDPIAPLSSSLRSAICAAPGKDLIGADYAGIENRVLLWRVGDTDAIAKINHGVDLYIDMACSIFGCKYDELEALYKKGDIDATFKRSVGKRAVLGAGYQMGWPRFKEQCAEKGIEIDDELAKRTIESYRQKYNKVVRYWYKLEDYALKKAGPFRVEGRFLQFRLPSGRLLNYCDPEYTQNRWGKTTMSYMGVDSKTRKWVRIQSFGGKWTENEIQAISRDIMVLGMLRAEAAGYPIIFNIYDELVAEVDKDFGSVNEFVKLLCKRPSWAQYCLIKAAGWRGERFRK
jgi:DNA polymerase